jgi:prepilin-type N-terminal cleavage/methylation domain-containing protein
MIFKRNQLVCRKDTKSQRKYINKTWCLGALRFDFAHRPELVEGVAKRKGMTLTEMVIVIGIIALMVGLTLPVANMLYNSFESTGGVEAMINAALESAKSIAIKEQHYAGIRFQKRYDPANPDPLNASQYIIFIINEKNRNFTHNLASGFYAVEGIQPIKLPDSIGVMDLEIRTNWTNASMNVIGAQKIDDNQWIDSTEELNDTTAFSIIFSPSGKLVIHGLRVRNRDGDTDGTETATHSMDDTFNTIAKLNNSIGMFLQDDYADRGYGAEMSRNSFIIYDTRKFKQEYKKGTPYSGYLNQLKPVFVSPYSGTIIEEK